MTRWLLWTAFIVSWTVALEAPMGDTEQLPGGAFIVTNKYIIAKGVHIAAYAFLTALSAWVRAPMRYRWLLMFALMAHGSATELLQIELYDYCHRGGELADVGFDHAGVLVGALASWRWWTCPELSTAEAQRTQRNAE